jgi:hypothetical protein
MVLTQSSLSEITLKINRRNRTGEKHTCFSRLIDVRLERSQTVGCSISCHGSVALIGILREQAPGTSLRLGNAGWCKIFLVVFEDS